MFLTVLSFRLKCIEYRFHTYLAILTFGRLGRNLDFSGGVPEIASRQILVAIKAIGCYGC